MSDKPKRPKRGMLTVRAGEAGVEALDRIAADFQTRSPIDPKTGEHEKVTRSDVHRQALAEFVQKYDPLRKKTR